MDAAPGLIAGAQHDDVPVAAVEAAPEPGVFETHQLGQLCVAQVHLIVVACHVDHLCMRSGEHLCKAGVALVIQLVRFVLNRIAEADDEVRAIDVVHAIDELFEQRLGVSRKLTEPAFVARLRSEMDVAHQADAQGHVFAGVRVR